MSDTKKTKKQLIDELARLRSRVSELDEGEFKRTPAGEETDRFLKAIEIAKEAINIASPDGGITYTNNAMDELFGYEEGELIGKPPSILNAGPVPESVTKQIMDAIEKRGFWEGEIQNKKKEGTEFTTYAAISALKDKDGKILDFISTQHDITELKRTMEALKESEQRYRRLAENLNEVIYTTDLQGNVTYITPNTERLGGYRPAEIIGRSFVDFVHPDDLSARFGNFQKILAGEDLVTEYRYLTKEKEAKWVRTNARPIIEEGEVVGVQGMLVDITDRKLAEEALKKSEERYRLLADNVSDNIWVLRIEDLRFTYISSAVTKTFGFTPEESMDMPLNKHMPPESVNIAQAALAEELEKDGKPGVEKDRFRVLEIEQFVKNGGTVWTEVKASFLRDEKGNPVSVLGVTRDITGRKKAERALRESEEKFRSLFDSSPLGVALSELETGRLVEVNELLCKTTKFSKDELLGNTTTGLGLYSEADRDRFLGKLKSTGRVSNMSMTFRCREGQAIQTLMSSNIIRLAGKPYALTLFLDITEKKQLEEQLRQSQKMESIGRLAGGVAHDFNNLLTAIIGYAEMLEAGLDPDDPLSEDVKQIMKAGDSAAQLTSQLLAFSRKQTIDPKVIDINQTMEHLQRMLGRLIGEDIDLLLVPGKDLGRIKADPGQVDQTLINLAVNACDAMPDGGKLVIETANVTLDEAYCKSHLGAIPGDFVMLAVSDDGCGMKKDVLDKIFEPFFTTKERGKGTGLGLSMVYGIVKQHGGFVYAYSEPGEGTTIKTYWPRVAEEADPIGKPRAEASVTGNETVLLVEDEELVRRLAGKILEQSGYRVLAADDGGDAIKICKEYGSDINLLLTDVVMPEMNGKELYDQIAPTRPGIHVLYMSGYTDDAIVHRGVLDEGTAYIQKPFKAKELLDKVREVLKAPAPRTSR